MLITGGCFKHVHNFGLFELTRVQFLCGQFRSLANELLDPELDPAQFYHIVLLHSVKLQSVRKNRVCLHEGFSADFLVTPAPL